jgi:hypothetical protein
MGRADELEAELEVVKLEEHLVVLKADPKAGDADLRRVKLALREARQAHRALREAAPPEAAAGDAAVRPATVKAKAGVKRPGGDG